MKMIDKNIKNELIIKNSRFITYLYKVNDVDEVNNYLDDIKKIEKDANHYTYAYITLGNEKCSDDGEPGGTAGIPILNVIKKNNLTNILVVVIRYFGGIKLGASGLVRAYSNSISDALKRVNIIEVIYGKEYIIEFDYFMQDNIKYMLRESIIKEEIYQEKIIYKVISNNDIFDKLSLIRDIKISDIKETVI